MSRMLPTRRIDLMGCPVDAVSIEDAIAWVAAAIRNRAGRAHSALNVAKLVKMRRDRELHRDVVTGDLITADGMGVVLAARLLGTPLPERVTGIDLMDRVLALCARESFRPYILGARPEVLDKALRRLRADYPGLTLAGARHGYFRPEDEPAIVAEINDSGADCLFVGVPTPMKERFIARNRARLMPGFVMGVGGSIDVLAGHVKRAPVWMQRAGLEWLFRTLQEPGRMWRRYLVTNAAFAVLLAKALVCRAVGRAYLPLAAPASQSPSVG